MTATTPQTPTSTQRAPALAPIPMSTAVLHPLPADPRKQLYGVWEYVAYNALEQLQGLTMGERELATVRERVQAWTAEVRDIHQRQSNYLEATEAEPLRADQKRRWSTVCDRWIDACKIAESVVDEIGIATCTPSCAAATLRNACNQAAVATRAAYEAEMQVPWPLPFQHPEGITFLAAAREWRSVAVQALEAMGHLRRGERYLDYVIPLANAAEVRADATHAAARVFQEEAPPRLCLSSKGDREAACAWAEVAKAANEELRGHAAGGALHLLIAGERTMAAIAACDAAHPSVRPAE